MKRRELIQYLASLTPAASLLPAHAQEAFPSRPIRIISTSAPGALLDAACRLYAERMSAHLKQPVVVENVTGAGGLLAVRQVAKAVPDGYTLLGAANTISTVPHLNSKAGYSIKDFSGIGEMARSPSLLVVSATSPFKSLADIVSAARKSPGQVSYASGGIGTTSHIPVEVLAREAGIKLIHVPYKGNAVAVPDVVSNQVGFMMASPTSLVELMKSGRLRGLAIASDSRSTKFPDLPTFKELGYPEVTFEIWVGLMAPASIPKDVRARLGDAIEAARKDATVIARLEALGQEISNVRTPEQFDAVLRQENERYGKLIKQAGIVVE